MKKRNSEILMTVNVLQQLIQQEQNTKFEKIFTKVLENLKKYIVEYNDKLEEYRLDYASVDKNNNLLLDEKGNYTYNKDNFKKLKKQTTELLDKEIDVEKIEIFTNENLDEFKFLIDLLEITKNKSV